MILNYQYIDTIHKYNNTEKSAIVRKYKIIIIIKIIGCKIIMDYKITIILFIFLKIFLKRFLEIFFLFILCILLRKMRLLRLLDNEKKKKTK